MLEQDLKDMRDQFNYLEKKISEYNCIIIYRHQSPDFDALGSQMGLYQWIKDNFPSKEVHYVGDRHPTFMPDLFPYPEELSDDVYAKEHLAITVDVANSNRIADNHIGKAKEIIKIDHHPIPERLEERFGDYLIVYPNRPAASELIALFAQSRGGLFKKKRVLSVKAASYLYCGIVGDTGRFMYSDTDGATLRIAADLIDLGIDKGEIYRKMYATDIRRLNILKYCLNNFKITDGGTCYFIFKKEDLEALHMTIDEGNLHINAFRDLDNVRVVCSITQNPSTMKFRVSLRSKKIVVAPVANMFNGGGHDYAAGCTLESLDDLPKLLKALDDLKD